MKKRIEIEIFGERYIIKSNLDVIEVNRIAAYVDSKMKQIKKSAPFISTSKIAILAALNVTEELFELLAQKEDMEHVVKQKSSKLLKLLDECVNQ